MQRGELKISNKVEKSKGKYILFIIIKKTMKIFYRKHCRIDSIKKDHLGVYNVYFLYIAKRQIFVKTIEEIIRNKYLLSEFSSVEVAILGFYQCIAQFDKGNIQISEYLNIKSDTD